MVKYDSTYALATNAGSSAKAATQYIILHDTGNANNTGTNSAVNEAVYMKSHWQYAYTHAIAGWDRVYLIGEPGYVAYGAGSPANEQSPFQIELARYADHDKAIAAYQNWIAAAVYYADKYGIPRTLDGSGNGIKSHKWVSDNLWGDHQDPYAYLTSIGISKTQLAADLKAGKAASKTAAPKFDMKDYWTVAELEARNSGLAEIIAKNVYAYTDYTFAKKIGRLPKGTRLYATAVSKTKLGYPYLKTTVGCISGNKNVVKLIAAEKKK
ncbi:N-acetylmuramoyl-L-alanine amidase [Lacticaseibacillus yichunensis]|uniref:N-acetylmuramoyl-L-alanine amidase n=1 Tax=Lacticaseibacillus yichunensis TaxID=2486015 RepID=A0ABW4CKB9_9LACO|nr:N-acetylmuramoyl-L-alanine amidase [Lacticaseibacillus yichunensis]